jgi:hypothetical protein
MAGEKGERGAGQKQELDKRPHWWRRLWAWTGFGEKQLWDWLQLLSALAIPVVLAVAGFWLSAQQDERQRRMEDQRSQDETLAAYLDQMTRLMLEEDLRGPEAGNRTARTLARARTVTVLRRLDPDRRTSVVLFLQEAGLIQGGTQGIKGPVGYEPVISLFEANLVGTDINNTNLTGADLHDAKLADADLSSALLRDADFSGVFGADLRGADLSDASLSGANFGGADLSGADLTGADLTGAKNLTQEQIDSAARGSAATQLPAGLRQPAPWE